MRPTPRASPTLAVVGAAGVVALVAALALVRRVEVVGTSMAPTLVPGDRLLVVRVPDWWRVHVGDLVAVPDPRGGGPGVRDGPPRLLVKRVVGVGAAAVEVQGDNAAESTDSRTFGPVPRSAVSGLVVSRYAPGDRRGRLGRGRPASGLRSERGH